MHPAVFLEDHQGFEGFATCDRHVFVAVVKMVVFLSLLSKMATRVRGATMSAARALPTTAHFDVQRVCMARAYSMRCTIEAPQSRERTLFVWRDSRRKAAKSQAHNIGFQLKQPNTCGLHNPYRPDMFADRVIWNGQFFGEASYQEAVVLCVSHACSSFDRSSQGQALRPGQPCALRLVATGW